ncbi:protein C19orf12 homolog [Tachysurus fulvidraco]|uniref:protein C19orf12 homolog n=1 Tax=Tachysurus fulvidraco TaxID=1234273 RepID=UPI000F4E1CC5|nr:protein C19orf12 homolog [Tachysurus fulvidraco]XP_047671543.1 protein C19orf12 homolog [Tachysurus fulvidraco]
MEQKINDVVQMCCEVSASRDMKATVKGSLKGGAMAGGSAVVGSLLLGPVGLAVGAAAGGLVAWMTSGQFKPVPQILMELPPQEKQKLYSEISVILGSLDWTDVTQLMFLVRGNKTMLQRVEAGIQSFVNNSLGAELKYGN